MEVTFVYKVFVSLKPRMISVWQFKLSLAHLLMLVVIMGQGNVQEVNIQEVVQIIPIMVPIII